MNRSDVKLSIKCQSSFTIKGDPMNFSASDDPEGIVGFGETPELAKADFWEQWEDRQPLTNTEIIMQYQGSMMSTLMDIVIKAEKKIAESE